MAKLARGPLYVSRDEQFVTGETYVSAAVDVGSGGLWSPERRERYRRAKTLRARLPDTTPKHVKACFHNGGRAWWIYTWPKDEGQAPTKATRSPYLCQSWRCEGCRDHVRHVLFARMAEALESVGWDGWTFWTFTLATPAGATWRDVHAVYKELSRAWRLFKKRLNRWLESHGMAPVGNEWIAVVEAHRSGWPHLHVILRSTELAQYLEGRRRYDRTEDGKATFLPPDLVSHAMSCGWGRRCTVDPVRDDPRRLLNYVNKLAGEHSETTGELAKQTQLPTCAPGRLRRVRSGVGFLPPKRESNSTGTLLRHRFDAAGVLEAFSLQSLPDVLSRQLAEHEESIVAAGEVATIGIVVPLVRTSESTRVLSRDDIRRQRDGP